MPVRNARLDDASSLAALSIEVWLGTYIRRGVTAFFADDALGEFTAEKFRALLNDPGERLIVSQNQDGIDGFVRITSARPAPVAGCGAVELSTLYVQPRHHGKGIGKALLGAALAHAQERGSPALWLTTNSENTPAIGVYHAQGFETVGTTHFRIGDEAYPNAVLCHRFAGETPALTP